MYDKFIITTKEMPDVGEYIRILSFKIIPYIGIWIKKKSDGYWSRKNIYSNPPNIWKQIPKGWHVDELYQSSTTMLWTCVLIYGSAHDYSFLMVAVGNHNTPEDAFKACLNKIHNKEFTPIKFNTNVNNDVN
jgi:hypothetical protein